MKKTLTILALVLSVSVMAETRGLPDLRGVYGLDTEQDIQLFQVNSNSTFELIDNTDHKLHITINRVDDRIDVAGVVTYFISVTVNGKSDVLELVHNQKADYFMMELESDPSMRWKSVSNNLSMLTD